MHTAPGHGADDFNTGQQYGLETLAPIGPAGHFLDTVELFAGQRVFDANASVEAGAEETRRLLAPRRFLTSVPALLALPHPVIFLATSQWFIRMDGEAAIPSDDGQPRTLRQAALEAIDHDVNWVPSWGHDRIYNMVIEPPGLVHFAPARVGRADSCRRLHEVRRGDHDA